MRVLSSSIVLRGAMVCLAILVAAAAWAQAPVGTISGVVRDPSDAVLPGVSITIRQTATGAERNLTSGNDGTFSAPALAAGAYTVTAELPGFRTARSEASVATGQVTHLEIHMPLGQASEAVEVIGQSVHVDLETHAISGVITRQKIQELPLNGRSFLQLALDRKSVV